MFIAELLTILKTTQATTDRWADKENKVHIHSGVLIPIKKKKEGNPIICNMDDLENIVLSEIRQREKEKKMHDITYTWNLIKKKKKKSWIGKPVARDKGLRGRGNRNRLVKQTKQIFLRNQFMPFWIYVSNT